MDIKNQTPEHLAWHETMELHELVAFQAVGLMKLKETYPKVDCPTLRRIYKEAIDGISANLRELMAFYDMVPTTMREERNREDLPFYSGDLLALSKTSVRNYGIAITETATPALRRVFKNHLSKAIDLHAKVFAYMYERSYYPAYNLNQLLQNDINLANKALEKSI